jgi:hypothetical protein
MSQCKIKTFQQPIGNVPHVEPESSVHLFSVKNCKTCKPPTAVTLVAGGRDKAGRIVSKGIQAGSPAAISDSLHLGDELVSISGRAIGKSL